MGLCVPKQCSVEQVQTAFAPLMTEYAVNSGWNNVQVLIEPSGYYTKEVARSFTKEKAIGLGFLGLLFFIVVAATIVQVSSIGDKKDSRDEPFESSVQYEANILERKEVWA